MIYNIEIEETLSKIVQIEADTLEEALRLASRKYYNEEIIVDSNDLVATLFNVM